MLDILGWKVMSKTVALATKLVPRRAYEEKVAAILGQDEKNRGQDLRGWEYLTVESARHLHRYYHHQASNPGAPPMVMLHGLNLDGRNFLEMKELAGDFELFAYDFPEASGHYRGRLDDFIALIDDFIDVLDLETVFLVGISLGGMIAIRYAGAHRVRALILISSRIPGYHEGTRQKSVVAADMVTRLRDYQFYWLHETLAKNQLAKLPREQGDKLREILRPKRFDFYIQVARSLRNYNGRADAEAISCPTLLLVGTDDNLIPLESTADFRESVPHGRVEVIDGGRHDMTLFQPELVYHHIRKFLEDEGLSPGPSAPRSA